MFLAHQAKGRIVPTNQVIGVAVAMEEKFALRIDAVPVRVGVMISQIIVNHHQMMHIRATDALMLAKNVRKAGIQLVERKRTKPQ